MNVVNLLASQWGEMFSNVSDFDGRRLLARGILVGMGVSRACWHRESHAGARAYFAAGLFGAYDSSAVFGGTVGIRVGRCTGSDDGGVGANSALIRVGCGVMPHGPNPQCERAADIVLGLIHAMEMMTFNPHNARINPYGLQTGIAI